MNKPCKNEYLREILLDAWRAALGTEQIGLTDSFFALGGDSLAALRIVTNIRRHGVSLNISDMVSAPTIESLIALLESRGGPTTEWSKNKAQAPPSSVVLGRAQGHTTPIQKGFYLYNQLHTQSDTLVLQYLFKLTGKISPIELETRWKKATERFELLRSSFRDDPEYGIVQEPHASIKPDIRHSMIVPPVSVDVALEKLFYQDRQEVYHVNRPGLFRVYLVSQNETEYFMLWSIHHLIIDGWSLYSVLDFVFHGTESSYKDFSEVSGAFGGDWIESDYWKKYLANYTSSDSLLRSCPIAEKREEDHHRILGSIVDTKDIRSHLKRENLTVGSYLYYCWLLALAQENGDGDVLTGVAFAGRTSALVDADLCVGPFVNTLPLRYRFSADRTILDGNKSLAKDLFALMERSDQQLAKILKAANLPSRAIQSMVVFDFEKDWQKLSTPSLQIEYLKASERTEYPLTLELRLTKDQVLNVELIYETARLASEDMEQLFLRFTKNLETLHRKGNEPESVPHVSTSLLSSVPDVGPDLFLTEFLKHALKSPNLPAAQDARQTLTYGELLSGARRVAESLQALGGGVGQIVGVLKNRDIDFLISILGIWLAGGSYLPLDPNIPADRLETIGENCNLILSDSIHDESLLHTSLRLKVRYLSWMKRKGREEKHAWVRLKPESLAYIIFTSGSTGAPKGAMVAQSGMYNHLQAKVEDLNLDSGSIIAQTARQSFDISIWQFLNSLVVGGKTIVLNHEVFFDPYQLLEILNQEKITILEVVPGHLAVILEAFGQVGDVSLPHLKYLLSTGEALPSALANRWLQLFPKIPIVNAYGPTECSDDVTHFIMREPMALGETVPIGYPVRGIEAHIVDDELRAVPNGQRGELCIVGISVGLGYFKNPEQTRKSFVPNPFGSQYPTLYKTGDLVFANNDGALVFLGRKDHQVKISGYRIELGEIENVMTSHPEVEGAIAAVIEFGDIRKDLAAAMTLSNPNTPTEEIATLLRRRLPIYMVPKHFFVFESLPTTSNGKIDRKEVNRKIADLVKEQECSVASSSMSADPFAVIWKEVLHCEFVAEDAHFFRSGGDSISALMFISKANKAGLRLELRDIFTHPVYSQLKRQVSAKGGPSASVGRKHLPFGFHTLSPIQLNYVDYNDPAHTWFALATAVQTREKLNIKKLQTSLTGVCNVFPLLGARYVATDRTFRISPLTRFPPKSFNYREFKSSLAEAEAEIIDEIHKGNQGFDITEGDNIRLHVAKAKDETLIVLSGNHLVVDAVSLNHILSTVLDIYVGKTVVAPSTSYIDWVHYLHEPGHRELLYSHLDYWKKELETPWTLVPDRSNAENKGKDLVSRIFKLQSNRVQRLPSELCVKHQTEVLEILVAALGHSLSAWTGKFDSEVLIDLEGHGREPLSSDIDIAESVGWFTSIFPVKLGTAHPNLSSLVAATKNKLRQIPNRGVTFNILKYFHDRKDLEKSAPVLFNYLGRTSRSRSQSSTSGFYSAGVEFLSHLDRIALSPGFIRAHLIEIECRLCDDELAFNVLYSQAQFEAETIEKLGQRFLAQMRLLLEFLDETQTVSTIGYDTIGITESERAEVEESIGGTPLEIYPVSPAQQDILYASILSGNPHSFLVQYILTISCELTTEEIQARLKRIVDESFAMSSQIRILGSGNILQFRSKAVDRPQIEFVENASIDSIIEEDRHTEFDFTDGPLLKLRAVRESDRSLSVVMTYHHVLLDGWSAFIILNRIVGDLTQLEVREHNPPQVEQMAREQYSRHAAIERHSSRAFDFWKVSLAGAQPTILSGEAYSNLVKEFTTKEKTKLEATFYMRIVDFVRRTGVTLNSLTACAWAHTLAELTGGSNVVFGMIHSGRTLGTPGLENLVGCFANLIPLWVNTSEIEMEPTSLATLQLKILDGVSHSEISVSEINRAAGCLNDPLFNTVIATENYQSISLLQDPRVQRLDWYENAAFDFTLGVIEADGLIMEMDYNPKLFSAVRVQEIRKIFFGKLEALTQS